MDPIDLLDNVPTESSIGLTVRILQFFRIPYVSKEGYMGRAWLDGINWIIILCQSVHRKSYWLDGWDFWINGYVFVDEDAWTCAWGAFGVCFIDKNLALLSINSLFIILLGSLAKISSFLSQMQCSLQHWTALLSIEGIMIWPTSYEFSW